MELKPRYGMYSPLDDNVLIVPFMELKRHRRRSAAQSCPS